MARPTDPFLQAAEGFLHAVRDDIDQLDLRLDDSLRLCSVYALLSIARSLGELIEQGPPVEE